MSKTTQSFPARGRLGAFMCNQRGSISVMAAATMVPFVLAAGTAIEMSRINRTLGHMQKAVDSAALAGAATHDTLNVADGGPLTGDEARIYAARRMVEANLPEQITGSAEAPEVEIDGTQVTVSLEAEMATSFMKLVGLDTMSLDVTATADFSVTGNACIVALGAEGGGIEVGGNVDVDAGDCWLHSNKVGTKSIDIVGGAVVEAGGTHSYGSTSVSNNATMPPPHNRISNTDYRINDPLAGWDHPELSGTCDYNKFKKSTSGNDKTITLSPGHYCGGLQLSGYDEVILEYGIYHISDGALSMNSQGNIIGQGVGFYIASDVSSVTINGGATVDLSAYDAYGNTPMDGKLFAMETVEPTKHNTISVKINGGSGLDLAGTVYLPTGELEISGDSSTATIGAQILAHSVKLSGTSHLSFTPELDEFGNPIGPEFVTSVKLIQ